MTIKAPAPACASVPPRTVASTRRPALAAVVVALLCFLALPSTASTASNTGLRWVMTGSKINQLRALDPGLADYHFNTPLAFATGNEDGTQNQLSTGYSGTATLKYESYARFAADVAASRIAASITAVMYDPENWSLTPDAEKRDPKTYMRRFYELANRHGYYVLMGPSRDLMQVTSAVCRKQAGESLSTAFLRCRIAEVGARYSDAYQVQSQVHENDPTMLRWFVSETRRQALAANPSVTFLAGLSTSPFNYVATERMLFDAHVAVKDLVDGYFFTINSPELSLAASFLRAMRASGY